MSTDAYLEAARQIRAGETRSFHELAALAGKPAAARAAGRAIAACPIDDPRPWHRVVAADGALAREPDRARVQLERLRGEGARPRAGESIARWARRRRKAWIANWRTHCSGKAEDPRVQEWPADRVEALASSDSAVERGFPALKERPHPKPPPRARRGADPARPRGRAPSPSILRMEPRSAEVAERLRQVDWSLVRDELGSRGAFTLERFLDARPCGALRELAEAPELFERTIDMAPRGYGVGTYRYFKEPLPEPAFTIREELYSNLTDLARDTRSAPAYPPTLAQFFEQCRAAGQRRSSSILLSYAAGGVNHPHRDIYGKLWFPYQAVLVLSAREQEFEGGDLVLCTRQKDGTEQRRRLPLDQGDLCLFASRGFEAATLGAPAPKETPKESSKGAHGSTRRSPVKPESRWVEQTHGLTTVTRGTRSALGIVLHLAQ